MLWKPSLLVRLLAPYLVVLLAVAVALFAYGDGVAERFYSTTVTRAVGHEARLVGHLLPWDLRGPALDARCAAMAADVGARITVVAVDGTVLGDSAEVSAGMENLGSRPEVKDALRGGDGESTRRSTERDQTLAYVAWKQDREGESRIIRLAVPVEPVALARRRIRMALWGGVMVAALAALIPAWIVSRRLSIRLSRLAQFSNAVAQGRTPPVLVPEGDDTVSRLQSDLIAMADSLSAQLRAAREEKGKLEGVLGGMVEGVLVIDRHGMIRLVNQRAQELFGKGSREIQTGEPLIDVVRDPELQEIVRAVVRGDTERPLIREITIEGRERDSLQVTASAIGDGTDGGPELYILVFHDVTSLKRLEATRRDFVANVSHELRTPLTAIRGYAETLREGALSDPALARKFVGIIERHSERLSRLIEDLLSLSDLELGRTELRRGPVKLGTCVDAVIEILRDKAEHGRVEIQREVPAEVPPIYADTDRVEQVLVNLIDNAVKYTPSGGRVRVMAATADASEAGVEPGTRQAGGWVRLTVADNGIGIPSTDLPRLTERFYRVDKARSRELGGTGLGLAIVKHIVQAHGGGLRIESDLGRGTRVHVYWPRADDT